MSSITILAMTIKSFLVLKRILPEYKSLIREVVIAKDKTLENDYSEEIRKLCEKYKVNYILRKGFKNFKTKYVLVLTWRWLVYQKSKKIILFHDSILPKYRGFCPVINSLINGEKKLA